MAREVARIPPDLRGRKDMTLEQIERVLAIRTIRKRLQTRLDGLAALKAELEDGIRETHRNEMAVLATTFTAAQ